MDTKLIKEPLLSSNLNLRVVKWTDLNAVAQLIYDVCEADGDTTVAVTPEELKIEWQSPGFNLETDALLVETKDGRVIGFEELYNAHAHAALQADGYFHPEFKAYGVGTALLRAIEERARKEIDLAGPDLRVSLKSTLDSHDEVGRALHENEGYHSIRFHWRMEIKLQEPPPAPLWPAGVELRPFIKGKDDRSVWEADQEAFLDHWGSHPISFEDWKHRKFSREDFDPTL